MPQADPDTGAAVADAPEAGQPATAERPGMWLELDAAQEAARQEFRRFTRERVAPEAGRWDREGKVDPEAIDELRRRGWLGALLPEEVGGGDWDPVTYGLLTEEIGRGCSSLRSLLTVHEMGALALARWASRELKAEVLPSLAGGERLIALALSEPEVGSDAASVATSARRDGGEDGDWVLDGTKRWITFGQIADLFLVFARVEGEAAESAGKKKLFGGGGGEGKGATIAAFLVPADAPGFSRAPIGHIVGSRASQLAELTFDGCRVPAGHLVGRVGFGFSPVAATALDQGRYSVAWGSVGLAQACLDACLEHTAERQQFGATLNHHHLVRRKLTEMIVGVRAARLLCYRAGHLRRQGDPSAASETLIAKYQASRTATACANDAVQLHGAWGLSEDRPLERYLRDAKVTEIIEGSSQILQTLIPRYPLPEL